ncbi:MAG: chromosomal replication initiator protein DnaA [Malacoplasma sp.]|nr:chromosomal replication initiator protein DnaA [Malacoplasma sp.]
MNNSQIKKIYSVIKKEIQKEFDNENFYNNFVQNSSFFKFENQNVFLIVENEFIKEVLNNDYKQVFEDYFSSKTNSNLNVFFITKEEKDTKKELNLNLSKIKKSNITLNKNLTFEDYTIGIFNKDAYKAANFIFDGNNSWKTLLIYANTGLGKTHFLHAIGNKYESLFPEKNILYIQTEDFLEKIYRSISEGGTKIEEFKNSFNDVDLLLIDDIQFLNNKEKLNEIFFNIFNKLNSNNKLIIMTSDKLPSSLKIDDRMISRFNSGLNIKINKPDIDSIKKIVINKIKKSNIKNTFSLPAIEYIAFRFNNDIRSLEGILNKIYFFLLGNINGNEIINEKKIKEIIDLDSENSITDFAKQINPEIVIETVCLSYGVSKSAVTSKKRNKEFSFVRKVCMYILREKLNLSYNEIGSFFSNRNHATVIESIKDIEDKKNKDKDLSIFLENISNKF